MIQTLLEQVVARVAPPLEPLTVDQYHQMIRAGILPEGAPVELIDGLLVRKDRGASGGEVAMQDPLHTLAVKRLQRLAQRLDLTRYHLAAQMPVTLTTHGEPEPDGAVVRGVPEAFANRHPGPRDLVAVMEVANSSLSYDRTTKQRLYAAAGIGTYWIVNLIDRVVEVYTQPLPAEGRYAQITTARPGDVLTLPLEDAPALAVPVAALLPEAPVTS